MASPTDRQGEDMNTQFEIIEARLQSFLSQFQSELGVLGKIVHKNKNQHRRSSYFQYLLKVRRDCKLLQSTNLEELVNSSFLIINGNRPKQKVQLLESLKRKKCDGGKHNFLVRLQGAARLLSQMVEPMMRAAIEISTLLARSFFMGFSMTILALLARLRVLTQQILLDVVLVFNMVSSLSQKQQSVKLNQEGIEVFREYYPKNEEEVVFLECVWENDKFILLEKKTEPDNKILETTNDDVICEGLSTVEYQSIETILGAQKPVDIIADKPSEENPSIITHDCKQIDNQNGEKDNSGVLEPSSSENQEHEHITSLNLLDGSDSLKRKPELKKKMAFVSVKIPEPKKNNDTGFSIKKSDEVNGKKEDPFFSLLTGGTH